MKGSCCLAAAPRPLPTLGWPLPASLLLCGALRTSIKWEDGTPTAQWSGPDGDEPTGCSTNHSASQTCGYPGFLLTAGTLRSWLQGSLAQVPTHRLMLWGRPPWPVMDVTVMPELQKYNSHSLLAHQPGASGIRAPSPSPVCLSSEPSDKDPCVLEQPHTSEHRILNTQGP